MTVGMDLDGTWVRFDEVASVSPVEVGQLSAAFSVGLRGADAWITVRRDLPTRISNRPESGERREAIAQLEALRETLVAQLEREEVAGALCGHRHTTMRDATCGVTRYCRLEDDHPGMHDDLRGFAWAMPATD